MVGQQYTFSWWLGNDQDNSPSEFQASWNGSVIFDQTNIPAQGYTSYSFTELMATSTSTQIQFGFRQDPAFFHLDDVTVVPTEARPAAPYSRRSKRRSPPAPPPPSPLCPPTPRA